MSTDVSKDEHGVLAWRKGALQPWRMPAENRQARKELAEPHLMITTTPQLFDSHQRTCRGGITLISRSRVHFDPQITRTL